MNGTYDYGYWFTVIVMSVITLVFAFSFTRPPNWSDWRLLKVEVWRCILVPAARCLKRL